MRHAAANKSGPISPRSNGLMKIPSGRRATFKAGQRIVKVVVLYCTTPKNGISDCGSYKKNEKF